MTYTTKSGDSFDTIAYKFYKDSRYVTDLINANRDMIATFIFSAGTEIIIPEVQKVKKTKTPPWK